MAKNKKCKELNTRIPEGLVGAERPEADPKLPLLPDIPIEAGTRTWLQYVIDTVTYMQVKAERGEKAQILHGHLHLSRLAKGRKLACQEIAEGIKRVMTEYPKGR